MLLFSEYLFKCVHKRFVKASNIIYFIRIFMWYEAISETFLYHLTLHLRMEVHVLSKVDHNKKDINGNLCIVCQKRNPKNDDLVQKPKQESIQHLLDDLYKLISYKDVRFISTHYLLSELPPEVTKQNGKYHCRCYQEVRSPDSLAS